MAHRPNRYPSFYDSSIDEDALDNELATHHTDGLMSKEDKQKLDMLTGESATFSADIITETVEKQFVTIEQKSKIECIKTEDGSICVDANHVETTVDRQFVTVEQKQKIEQSIAAEYDAESETLVLF